MFDLLLLLAWTSVVRRQSAHPRSFDWNLEVQAWSSLCVEQTSLTGYQETLKQKEGHGSQTVTTQHVHVLQQGRNQRDAELTVDHSGGNTSISSGCNSGSTSLFLLSLPLLLHWDPQSLKKKWTDSHHISDNKCGYLEYIGVSGQKRIHVRIVTLVLYDPRLNHLQKSFSEINISSAAPFFFF